MGGDVSKGFVLLIKTGIINPILFFFDRLFQKSRNNVQEYGFQPQKGRKGAVLSEGDQAVRTTVRTGSVQIIPEPVKKIHTRKKLQLKMNIKFFYLRGADIIIPGTGGDQIHSSGQQRAAVSVPFYIGVSAPDKIQPAEGGYHIIEHPAFIPMKYSIFNNAELKPVQIGVKQCKGLIAHSKSPSFCSIKQCTFP